MELGIGEQPRESDRQLWSRGHKQPEYRRGRKHARVSLGRRWLERCQQQSLVLRWLGIRYKYHGPDRIPGRHLGVSAQFRTVDLVEGNQQCQPEQRVCYHTYTW